MFDTHCHLNFKAFEGIVDKVIDDARSAGVDNIVVPGTDVESSKKALEIAGKYDGVYAAMGIHPHHVYELMQNTKFKMQNDNSKFKIDQIEKLVIQREVVAIGEIGLDRHIYQKTKYGEYKIEDEFMKLQKEFFMAQLNLAKKYQKSIIVHNREAKTDLLPLLQDHWDSYFEGRMVFHCCESNEDLLQFAIKHHIYIGVDGDVTYRKDKQDFIKQVPLELLVLETDSPFLLPEPLKFKKQYPNKPEYLNIIAEFVAKSRGEAINNLIQNTAENAKKLFRLK